MQDPGDQASASATDEAWEMSRLQVRCASLAAENDSLRMCLKDVTENNSALENALREKEASIRRKASATEKATLTGMAEMENQVEKYKQMLHELAASADVLSKDNVVLSTEVMQLRDRCQTEKEQGKQLEGRVGHLQVCATDIHDGPVRATVSSDVMLQSTERRAQVANRATRAGDVPAVCQRRREHTASAGSSPERQARRPGNDGGASHLAAASLLSAAIAARRPRQHYTCGEGD